uniref:ATP synthase F0 subunit 8 n=1 Tax=Alicella gigantea TaxID=1315966 RepID=A0A5B7KV63_9CRUS|nr:ATP synthase F0 subunit 8 [Alicella gigantea]QAT19462.1 ATP synthase F0 subunit 8 [Alicella gigantea]
MAPILWAPLFVLMISAIIYLTLLVYFSTQHQTIKLFTKPHKTNYPDWSW